MTRFLWLMPPTVLAVAAFALVAWFTGDLAVVDGWRPFETTAARAALIMCAAAAWVGWEFLRAARARRENARLLEALAAGGEGDSAARATREIALLRERFEEAAKTLKTARFRGADGEQRHEAVLLPAVLGLAALIKTRERLRHLKVVPARPADERRGVLVGVAAGDGQHRQIEQFAK